MINIFALRTNTLSIPERRTVRLMEQRYMYFVIPSFFRPESTALLTSGSFFFF